MIALLLGALAPSLAQADTAAYLSSNVLAGMLGGHLTHITGITITLAIYLYSAFYGLLFGGISAFLFFAVGVGMLLGSFLNASRPAGWSAVGIIALGYILNTFGGLSDKYSWLLKINPSYYAPGIDPLVYHQLIWWYPGVLLVAGLVLGGIGLMVFNRRDLPTS